MRICYWSSDVCSSDLPPVRSASLRRGEAATGHGRSRQRHQELQERAEGRGRRDAGRPSPRRGRRGDARVVGRVHEGRDSGEVAMRSEEHTSELQSLMRISYAVFCLKKKNDEQKLHNEKVLT